MPAHLSSTLGDLPVTVGEVLQDFVEAAKNALGPDLRAVVLFGSGAEGKLRATSDVNLLVVLTAFDPVRMDQMREPQRTARAAIRLSVMYLLEDELRPAEEAFAQKFADIRRRRRVLYGQDPFQEMVIPRQALVFRLKQVLLNLSLRIRESYVSSTLREERLPFLIADFAGPLRTSAASLLELEGQAAPSPKEALERMASILGESGWQETLRHISAARATGTLPSGVGGPVLLRMSEWARRMWQRTESLK